MSKNFQIGDMVRLKCGGIFMMVQAIRAEGYVDCVWHNGATPCREIYSGEILDRVSFQ